MHGTRRPHRRSPGGPPPPAEGVGVLDRRALAGALGVTRVARVTGLDRAGVEVACAVRPGGHVLQVTNGKGLTAAEAAAGALLEAAELFCAERVEPALLGWASPAELAARGVARVDPAELGAPAPAGAPLAWREGRDLVTGEAVRVPAAAVHVPPPGGPLLGLAPLRWTSNGMGAHPERPRALLHALLEAAERDGLARALPEGFTEEAVAARLVPPAALARLAPAAAALAARFGRAGLEAHLFDLRPEPRAVALPLAGALLLDPAGGPVPLTAGYACRPAAEDALLAALLEAAQSRLTDIHGAREDVGPGDAAGARRLRAACAAAARRARPPRSAPRPVARGLEAALRAALGALARAGCARAVAVDLAPPALGVHVVKVVAPGLLLSELL